MHKRKGFLLAAICVAALIGGCDDRSASDPDARAGKTSWLDWLKGKDEARKISLLPGLTGDYVRETQAGNYLAGQFAQYRQDWKTANLYIDKVIALDPGNIDLQQRAMILAMQSGDSTRAIMFARKVLEQDNKNLLALLFIAVDDIAGQRYGEAVRVLQKMPENGIADFIRPILIAWSQAPDKKVDQEALIANGPLHAYHALLIADYGGKISDPEHYFVNVVTGGGADRHILEMMADVYARQGQDDLANKIYDTLLTQDQAAAASSRTRSLAAKRDNHELALPGRVQTPAAGAAEAFYNMARILFQDESEDSALVFARLAQMLDPGKEDAKMLLASMMIRAGHPDDAVALYKSVKPGSPGYPESQRSAAELLEEEGRIDQSIAFLEQGYAAEKDANYLIQIGDVYRRADRHEDAIRAYDRAAAALDNNIGADHWQLLYARGMSYERLGNLPAAERDLEAALKFRPDHPYLLNYLGYSWADQDKKLDQALALIEKAATLKPDDGYIVDSLGWVFYKMGQYEKAAETLEKAIELVPFDPTINDHLGDAYWQVGRRNEARFQWQRALNHTKDEADKPALELKISDGLQASEPAMRQAKKSASPLAPVPASETARP